MSMTGESGYWDRARARYSSIASSCLVIPIFLAFWVGLVIVPLIILFSYSFFETKSFFTVYEPSFETWSSLFESGRWEVVVRTLRLAVIITMIELLIGFPFALWLAKSCRSKTVKAIVLALLTIPFFLDLSSRTIIWRAILGSHGLINTVLLSLGVVDSPLEWMLYTEWSVSFGMLLNYFATMVLPIYIAMTFIDDTLIQASNDLGASPIQTLAHVIIPLSLPGIMAGIVFTLGPALATWVEPGMLGGGFVNLLSNSVENAYTALKYPVVAALSALVVLLLAILLVLLVVLTRRFVDVGSMFRNLKS